MGWSADRNGDVFGGDLDEWAGLEHLLDVLAVPGVGDDPLEDCPSLGRVIDDPRGGGHVAGDRRLEVEGEVRIRGQVVDPRPGSGCAVTPEM